MSYRRRGRRDDDSSETKKVPRESDFSDLLYDAIPGVRRTKDIYESIEDGNNRGFKTLSEAEQALNDKLKFDQEVKMLENQLNDGGTAAIDAKAKLGQLLINTDNSRMLRKLERAVNFKTGSLDPAIKSRILSGNDAISPPTSDIDENESRDLSTSGNTYSRDRDRDRDRTRNSNNKRDDSVSTYVPLRERRNVQSDALYSMGSRTVPIDKEDETPSYNAFAEKFKGKESPIGGIGSRGSSHRGPTTGLFRRRKNSISSQDSEYSVGSVKSVRFNGDLGAIAQSHRSQTPNMMGDKAFEFDPSQSTALSPQPPTGAGAGAGAGDYGKYTQPRGRTMSSAVTYKHAPPPGTLEYFEIQLERSINNSGFTDEDMILLLKDARKFRSVEWLTVSSMFVKLAVRELRDTDIKVVAAVGYPFGTSNTASKVAEAKQAAKDGASRIKLMIAAGKVISEDWDYIAKETRLVLKHCDGIGIRVVYPTNRRINSKLRKKFDKKLVEFISNKSYKNKSSKDGVTSPKKQLQFINSTRSISDNEKSDNEDDNNNDDDDLELSLNGLRKQNDDRRRSGSRNSYIAQSSLSRKKNRKKSNNEDDDDNEDDFSDDYFDENDEDMKDDYRSPRSKNGSNSKNLLDSKSHGNDRGRSVGNISGRHNKTRSEISQDRPQSARPRRFGTGAATDAVNSGKYSQYSKTKHDLSSNEKYSHHESSHNNNRRRNRRNAPNQSVSAQLAAIPKSPVKPKQDIHISEWDSDEDSDDDDDGDDNNKNSNNKNSSSKSKDKRKDKVKSPDSGVRSPRSSKKSSRKERKREQEEDIADRAPLKSKGSLKLEKIHSNRELSPEVVESPRSGGSRGSRGSRGSKGSSGGSRGSSKSKGKRGRAMTAKNDKNDSNHPFDFDSSKNGKLSKQSSVNSNNSSHRASPRLSQTDSINSEEEMLAISPSNERDKKKNQRSNSKNLSKKEKEKIREKEKNDKKQTTDNRRSKYVKLSKANKRNSYKAPSYTNANANDDNNNNNNNNTTNNKTTDNNDSKKKKNGTTSRGSSNGNIGARDRATSNQWLKKGDGMPEYASLSKDKSENDNELEQFMAQHTKDTKGKKRSKSKSSSKGGSSSKR